jgi:hypothetical protein
VLFVLFRTPSPSDLWKAFVFRPIVRKVVLCAYGFIGYFCWRLWGGARFRLPNNLQCL